LLGRGDDAGLGRPLAVAARAPTDGHDDAFAQRSDAAGARELLGGRPQGGMQTRRIVGPELAHHGARIRNPHQVAHRGKGRPAPLLLDR
jgi:hypothetical protein